MQVTGGGEQVLLGWQGPPRHSLQLGPIGLDEEGSVGKNGGKGLPLGIHHDADTPPTGRLGHHGVQIAGEGRRDTACQHQRVSLPEEGQLVHEGLQGLGGNGGAGGVDLGLPTLLLELDVDAGVPLGQGDEPRVDPVGL